MKLTYRDLPDPELVLHRVFDYLARICCGSPRYWWDGKRIVWL